MPLSSKTLFRNALVYRSATPGLLFAGSHRQPAPRTPREGRDQFSAEFVTPSGPPVRRPLSLLKKIIKNLFTQLQVNAKRSTSWISSYNVVGAITIPTNHALCMNWMHWTYGRTIARLRAAREFNGANTYRYSKKTVFWASRPKKTLSAIGSIEIHSDIIFYWSPRSTLVDLRLAKVFTWTRNT